MKNELFYVECNKGWKQLYQPLIDRCNQEGVKILQIKEKFGTLRFYVVGASKELLDAIEEAEKKSGTICEICGNSGKLRKNGWWKTLCEEHNNKENN